MKKLTKTKMLCSMLIGAGLIASAGAFALNNVSASTGAVTDTADTFAMEYGAGVRLADPYGIRFKAKIGENVYNDIIDPAVNETKKAGMYIVPSAYVNNAAAYSDGTVGNYQNFNKKIDLVFYDSADTEVENKIYAGTDGYYYVNGVISDIMLENYGREFVGIAYIETTDTATSTTTYQFADFTLSDNARTATYVASAAWEDYVSYQDVLVEYVYGAYLYENKGATYDADLAAYKQGDVEYGSLSEMFTALDCSFTLDVAETSINMEVVAKQTLNAALKDGDGADTGLDLSVNWTSDAEDIVSVKDGVLTAMGVGEATVTASVLGYTDTVTVTVTDTRTTANLTAVDYDLSTTDALTVSGVEAEMQRVFMCKGEEEVDVTDSATQDGTTLSVAASALNGLTAGEWQIKVATADTYYVANVTVATMLINSSASMQNFYNYLYSYAADGIYNNTAAAATANDLIIVTDSFTVETEDDSRWGDERRLGFGGTFDGRGNVIDGLETCGTMFARMTGTFKNVAFINYSGVSLNNLNAFFAADGNGTGVISNVYLQGNIGIAANAGKRGESFVGNDNFASVQNVVLDVKYTAVNVTDKVYVVTGNNTGTGTNNNNYNVAGTYTTADKYSPNTIYAMAQSTVDTTVEFAFAKKVDAETGEATDFGTVYTDADALVAAENADGKMFDSADGWASYWVLQNDGIYFNGVKVQALTVEATKLSAVDYDLSVGGDLSVSGVSGALTSVSLSNGDSVQDVTASATLSEDTVTVAETAVSELAAGEWTLDVATTNGVYQANVTLATMLIYDETTFTAFYTYLNGLDNSTNMTNYASSTVGAYIVVTDNVTITASDRFWTNKYICFGGVFDGRGHVIDGLEVNGHMFYYMTGTFKNVAFTNYYRANANSTYAVFAITGGSTGTISNVYLQGIPQTDASKANESFLGGDTFASVENVVMDLSYTSAGIQSTVHVVCGNSTHSTGTYTDASKYASSNIYVMAKYTGSGTAPTFYFAKYDTESVGADKVYTDADALVAAENADGKMFDSADGWASYWEVKDDGIYFSGVKVSAR